MALTIALPAQERDRTNTPDKYTWDLSHIYASPAAWRAAKDEVAVEFESVRKYEGTLGSSPAALADAMDYVNGLDKEVAHRAMQQEMVQLRAALGTGMSYVVPEIIRIGAPTLEKFIASEPRLKNYAFYLRNVGRRAAHTLTDREEQILASAAPLTSSPQNTFSIRPPTRPRQRSPRPL